MGDKMNKNNVSFCPECGHKSVEYKHCINKTLTSCLARLNAMGGEARLDQMGLNNTQFANFQKLRYFGLAYSVGENNVWKITEIGILFLKGRVAVSKYVITKNANIARTSEDGVYITDIKDCVQYKIEWQEQARQPSLFD